jgi:ferredoxin
VLADELKINIPIRPFITVSVGMPGDHHVRKAFVEPEPCIECNLCIPACPTDAIPESLVIIRDLCIGCGDCEVVCPPKANAIKYEHNAKKLEEMLPLCLEAGAENIELHAAVAANDAIMKEWEVVCNAQQNHVISMCLDRNHLSNSHLIERIKNAHKIAGDRMIIQADGVPMSGGRDDYNTTLQAIAIADVIQKNLIKKERAFWHMPILLSGGTNSYTGKMAKMCDINFGGVAIGTHARKIVKPFIESENFDSDMVNLNKAVEIAAELVEINLSP